MMPVGLQQLLSQPFLALLAMQGAAPTTSEILIPPDARTYRAYVWRGVEREYCVLNPPLVLAAKGVARLGGETGYGLRQISPDGGPVRLVAFGPRAFFDPNGEPTETVALLVDTLTVTRIGVESQTGQAWQLLDREGAGLDTRLKAKSLKFSLCKERPNYDIGLASGGGRRGRFGALRGAGPTGDGIVARLGAAATAVLDIFGLASNSWIRVRLTSEPDGADIFLGRERQPPKTNAVLDIVAAQLPQLRLEKPGFAPCDSRLWKIEFERGSKRLVNASCKLAPRPRATH